jgi:hypothetical protein
MTGTREGNGHGAELSKDFVPLPDTGTFLVDGDAVQNLPQSLNAMLWQVNGHVDSIHNLTED